MSDNNENTGSVDTGNTDNTGNTGSVNTGDIGESSASSNSPTNPIVTTPAERLNSTPAESLPSGDTASVETVEPVDKVNIDYGYTKGEFDTDTSIKEYSDFANSIGLSKEQADAIRDLRETGKASKAESNRQTSIEGIDRLKREYGDRYDNSIATAKEIVDKLGIDFETMKTLEGQLGTYEVLSLFTKLGDKLKGEAKFTTGTQANIKSAEQRLEALRNNPEFMSSYNDEGSRNYSKNRKEMQELYENLYPSE